MDSRFYFLTIPFNMTTANTASSAQASTVSSHPTLGSPSTPGFGYIILPHPHTSIFFDLGLHHTISYLPEGYVQQPVDDITVCIWLGAGNDHSHALFH
jgi:hypothetical protein